MSAALLKGVSIYEHKPVFGDVLEQLDPNIYVQLFSHDGYTMYRTLRSCDFVIAYADKRYQFVCKSEDHRNALINEFAFDMNTLVSFYEL